MLTENAISYVWKQISRIAGLLVETPFPLKYGGNVVPGNSAKIHIEVMKNSKDQWYDILELPTGALRWEKSTFLLPPGSQAIISAKIPILFPEKEELRGCELVHFNESTSTLQIHFDLLAACFFMLSRWEETVSPGQDAHGRFPASASLAHRQGFLPQPVVDEYAIILREWLKYIYPRIELTQSVFRVQISHDIDHLRRASNPLFNCMSWVRDNLRQPDTRAMLKSVYHLAAGHGLYPYLWSAHELVDWARETGYSPVFYLMTTDRSRLDEGYDLKDPRYASLLESIRLAGFEIGLHAGYASYLDLDVMQREKELLENAIGKPVTRVRQHYLRSQTPRTWQLWQQAGFEQDSSLGYADAEGFRCGTCHPFHLYDLENDCMLDVVEEPLIVMDGSLFDYQKMDQPTARERILALAQKCKAVNGNFTLLWHNTSLIHTRHHWGLFYRDLVPELLQLEKLGLGCQFQ